MEWDVDPDGAPLGVARESICCNDIQKIINTSSLCGNDVDGADAFMEVFADVCRELQLKLHGVKTLDLNPAFSTKWGKIGIRGILALILIVEAGHFNDLQTLDLSQNRLQDEQGFVALCESFRSGHWKSLQVLRLNSNLLGNSGASALAESFQSGELMLESLDLSFNSVGEAAEDSGDDSRGSGAESLAGSIGHLRNLQFLNLSFNEFFCDAGVVALAKSLKTTELSKLKHLDMSSTGFGDAGAKALAELFALGQLSGLQKVDLSGNAYDVAGAISVAKSFQTAKLSDLEELNLSFNEAWDTGAEALAESLALGQLNNLRTLDLSGSGVGERGAMALAEAFHSGNLSKLEQFNLADNKRVGDAGAAALAESFQSGHLNRLVWLDLSRNGFGDAGAVGLAKALSSCHLSSLQTLHLFGNAVGVAGMQALAKSFQGGHLANLEALYLSNNRVGDAGAEVIAELTSLGHFDTLEVFDLSRNGIGHRGAVALVQSLLTDKWHTLKVCKSKLRVEGNLSTAVPLAESQTELKSRTVLLSGNATKLRNDTLWAVATAIRSSIFSHLEVLDLKGERVGDEGAVLLAESLQFGCSKNLRTVDLSENGVGDKGLVALAKALRWGNLTKLEYAYFHGREIAFRDQGIVEIAAVLEEGALKFLKVLQLFAFGFDADQISSRAKTALVNSFQRNNFLLAIICPDEESSTEVLRDVSRLRQRNEKLVATLRALEKEPEVPATHGKVFLCGPPGVGKTTLRVTLEQAWAQIVAREERGAKQQVPTRGIDVSYVETDGGEKPLMLALWDLAGQHEYEVLQSAFLPDLAFADGQATFFVILCNANKLQGHNLDSAAGHLLYWLKFISSNSRKDVDRRRRVLVVLNCFDGDRSGHDRGDWIEVLALSRKRFKNFLDVHGEPFILDARSVSDITPFKAELEDVAKGVLQRRSMPQICRTIQDICRRWAQNNAKYPVVTWEQYSEVLVSGYVSDEELNAATEYLHEAGLLILFRKLSESSSTQGRRDAADQTLVILNPEWFCQKVVGHLLLPEIMVRRGEVTLRSWMDEAGDEDASLPIVTLKKTNLDVPGEKIDEVLVLLLRLGLCYRLDPHSDRIFIPALIQQNEAPGWSPSTWNTRSSEHAWVMGFSLVLNDSRTTLLPMATLRKLQVDLAQRHNIGRRSDCAYTALKSCITFRCEGMDVLIEYFGQSISSIRDRLDVLVKPLIGNSDVLDRKEQINLAQMIVDAFLSITRDCCPGVELQRMIIKPWKVMDGWVPPEDRDVGTSVDDVKARVLKNGLQRTNWTVGDVLVKDEEVLSEEDLRRYLHSIHDKFLRTKEALETLVSCGILGEVDILLQDDDLYPDLALDTVSSEPGTSENFLPAVTKTEIEPQTAIILDALGGLSDKMDELSTKTEDIKSSIHEVIEGQNSLNMCLQNLERFSVEEKERSVPRFAYLRKVGTTKWWIKVKETAFENFKLHFLCEAPHGNEIFHQVKGQLGVDVRKMKDWLKKLAPILNWTLAIAFVAVKIAGTAALPGLGVFVPDIPANALSGVIQMTDGIAELSAFLSDAFGSAEDDSSLLDSVVHDVGQSSTSRNRDAYSNLVRNQRDFRGEARAAVNNLLRELSPRERKNQIGLTRVWLDDGCGGPRHVVWICEDCSRKYGNSAREI